MTVWMNSDLRRVFMVSLEIAGLSGLQTARPSSLR